MYRCGLLKGIAISFAALVAVQKNKCYMCGRFMAADRDSRKKKKKYTKRSLDHIIPLSHLDGLTHCNAVVACAYCNSTRGNDKLPPHLFRKTLYIRIAAIAYQLAK